MRAILDVFYTVAYTSWVSNIKSVSRLLVALFRTSYKNRLISFEQDGIVVLTIHPIRTSLIIRHYIKIDFPISTKPIISFY